jgi:hypothetical protein
MGVYGCRRELTSLPTKFARRMRAVYLGLDFAPRSSESFAIATNAATTAPLRRDGPSLARNKAEGPTSCDFTEEDGRD